MKRIPIEKATPGLFLAQKLERHDGVLLAKAGAQVTESLLKMLARMNIKHITIETETGLSPEERAQLLAQEEENLNRRFSRVDGDQVLAALKRAILKSIRDEHQEPAGQPGGGKPQAQGPARPGGERL